MLNFWFVESTPKQRFSKDEAFDATIRDRFLGTYRAILAGETAQWRATPEGRLAEIIVLDQFARNMFRGSPEAFAADGRALELAEEAIRAGADARLPRHMRQFLYMPFMHSESRNAHRKALWLFLKSLNFEALRYEIQHKRVIDRFGRYPHRNAVLGRESTPEEKEFLKTHTGW